MHPSTKPEPNRASRVLLALAAGVFAIGMSDLVPVGLLPTIAKHLGVSIAAAGLLITAYALTAVIGGPAFTAALGRLDKRRTLLIAMGVFIAGSVLSAIAPDYAVLLASRILSALAQGVFFAQSLVVAKHVVPSDRIGKAVSWVTFGLTAAVLLGSPLGSFLGHLFGWRMAFAAVAGFGGVSLAGIAAWVPSGGVGGAGVAPLRAQFSILAAVPVRMSLLTTLFGSCGVFVAFTYIAAILQRTTGFSPHAVTYILLVIGVGSVLGNAIGGRLAGPRLMGHLTLVLVLLAALMAGFAVTSHDKIGAVVTIGIWSVAVYALIPLVTVRLLQTAASAPDLAASLNSSAFNLGNALGAFIGSLVISSAWGLAAIPGVAAALTLVGTGFSLGGRQRRHG